jgi:hypothetical protein
MRDIPAATAAQRPQQTPAPAFFFILFLGAYQLQERRSGRNKCQPPRFFLFLFLASYQLQQRRSGCNKRQPRVKVHY